MTRLEENRFRSLPPSLLQHIPHYIIGANKLCKDVDISLRDDISGSELKHLVVGVKPPRMLEKGTDPVTYLVVKKRKWRQELETRLGILKSKNRVNAAETLHNYNKFLSHGKSGAIMYKRQVKFIEHIGKDPDAQFDGCCNWYYYGGQLSHFQIGGKVILTSVQGAKYDYLHFIPLCKTRPWAVNLNAAARVSAARGKTIFQVVSSDHGYTVARCRNCISLFTVNLEHDVIAGKKCFTASSKEPFLSVDVGTEYRDQICSVHMDNNLCVWDVNSQSKVSQNVHCHCGDSVREKWSTAVFGQSPHVLYYSDRFCVRSFDLRESLGKHVACWCIRNCKLVEKCEYAFSVTPGVGRDDSVYVGTTHHVLSLDMRKHSGVASKECWTHMFTTPPLYGCCLAGERKLLVLASQESSEVKVLSEGSLLPVELQSCGDYLRSSNLRGCNLEPQARHRLRASISGLTYVPADAGKLPAVLVQTAAGDVFLQDLRHGAPPHIVDMDALVSTKCRRLQVSNVLEMRHLLTAVKHGRGTNHESCAQDAAAPHGRFTWMKSKEKLLSYKDMLAPSILDAWDVDAMEEWNKRGTETMTGDLVADVPLDLLNRTKHLLHDMM